MRRPSARDGRVTSRLVILLGVAVAACAGESPLSPPPTYQQCFGRRVETLGVDGTLFIVYLTTCEDTLALPTPNATEEESDR